MSHIVKYRNSDGKTDYHNTDDIHDAVSFVEQLRNDQNVDGAQIFRLEEVSFDYRPYYRVELKAGEPMLAAAPAPKAAVASAPTPVKESPASSPSSAAPVTPVASTVKKAEPELVSVPNTPTAVPAAAVATPAAAPVAAATPVKPSVATPTPVKETASASADKSDSAPSVGARRGLFGR